MQRSIGRIKFGHGSLIYLGVMALITIAAFYTQANLLFWALGLVIGALIVSTMFALVSLHGLEVQRLTPTRGVADDPLILRYHLTNHSRLGWFGVELIETWSKKRKRKDGCSSDYESGASMLKGRPHGWVLHIGPGQTIQADAACWPRRRGLMRFEKIIVRSGFPFGIVYKHIEFIQSSEVLIHPPHRRLNRQTALSLSSQDIGHARLADRGGGQDEFFGLRPYRPGDSFKLIDWKHSARTNNLVSREMAKARPPRIMILLDLNRDASATDEQTFNEQAWDDAREEAISLAGALIRESYLHDIHVGLAFAGVEGQTLAIHHNQAHLQRLLDQLARLDVNKPQKGQATLPVRPTVVVKPAVSSDPSEPDKVESKAVIHAVIGRYRMPSRIVESSGKRQKQDIEENVFN